MSRRKLAYGTLIAVADQAWLSALNFLIGIAFIRYAPKEDYAVYLQLFAVLLLGMSIQAALYLGPLLTLAPKRDAAGEATLVHHLGFLQGCSAAFVALLSIPALLATGSVLNLPLLGLNAALLFAIWMYAAWKREYRRELGFLAQRPDRTAMLDGAFGLVLLLALAWLASQGSLSLITTLGMLAVANLISLLMPQQDSGPAQPDLSAEARRQAIRDAWPLARWALPGVLVTWVYTHSYLYISAAMLGTQATADLGAARLLLMPVGILLIGWGNVFLPRVSRQLGNQESARGIRAAMLAAVATTPVTLLFLGLLWLCFPLIQTYLLGEQYSDLHGLIIVWAAYFCLRGFSLNAAILLQAAGEFRRMFQYSFIGMLVGLTAVVAGAHWFGAAGCVAGLAVTELAVALLIWWRGVPAIYKASAA